jgi:hypothetical protein
LALITNNAKPNGHANSHRPLRHDLLYSQLLKIRKLVGPQWSDGALPVQPPPQPPPSPPYPPDTGAYNTTVTITGTNFSTTTTSDIVSFNGNPATVSAATATQLTVTVPKGAGTGTIKLTIGSNTITGPTFTYLFTYAVSTLVSTGFNDPFGIAVDTAGNVIVADDGDNQIKMVTPAGVVSTIAGSGTPGFMNGAAATAEFLDPPTVTVDPMDNIFVGDAFNYKIREISSGTVSTFAGTTLGENNGGVATAQFDSPTWLAIDGSENVFVCDAHYIREISGGSVSTLYDGHNYSSQLVSFTGIALKPADTLVLLDNIGANVFQLTPAGTFSVLAGTGSPGYYDAPAASAQFSSATGVAIDANGNILVADEANQRIRMISPRRHRQYHRWIGSGGGHGRHRHSRGILLPPRHCRGQEEWKYLCSGTHEQSDQEDHRRMK